MPVERFVVGFMGNNTYVVYDERSKEAAVIDPSMKSEGVLDWITQRGLAVRYVLNTHGHMDHVFNNALFVRETGAKLYIHQADEAMLDHLARPGAWMGARPIPSPTPDGHLADGQKLPLGDLVLQVLATPGHTPGSICVAVGGHLLTGDTLFQGSIGRFDFPGGSLPDLVASIKEKIFALPDETAVLPGHGPISSVGAERRSNPFVGQEARVDLSRWMERRSQ